MGLKLQGTVQIAGVIDHAEADLIIEAGADMLGFPLGLKDGREDLPVEAAAAIVGRIRERVTCVCITYRETADEIGALCGRAGMNWAQLHGPVSLPELEKLRSRRPDLGIIKSLIVRPGAEADLRNEVRQYEPHVDAFITDTYDPDTGRSGATGKTHDWSVSRAIVACTALPVILAGGLTADNVGAAITAVRPAAVDAHTGVEGNDGRKVPALVTAFVQNAHQAFAAIQDGYAPANYARRDLSGTDWLAFRDVSALLDQYLEPEMRALPALDFGCGAGRSTGFIASLGFCVTGADIKGEMIALARRQHPELTFEYPGGDALPWPRGRFGLVFSSFMLMEIESMDRMRRLFEEIRRVLHPEGIAVMVVNTPEFYGGRWRSCDVDFEENRGSLESGQKVRVRLMPEDLEIEDYFWSDADYRAASGSAGLHVLDRYLPLGHAEDNMQWRDEWRSAPYAIYVIGHART